MPILTQSLDELSLSLTLQAGQVFCWEQSQSTGEWTGVIDAAVFRLRQNASTGSGIEFSYSGDSIADDAAAIQILRDFFQLDTDLNALIDYWSKCDSTFAGLMEDSTQLAGLRICRQDPFECLISFIVSANNNIKRISQNLKSIRKAYGKCIDVKAELYAFPTPHQLACATSDELRKLGLGYRAEYIVKTAGMVAHEGMLASLIALRKEEDAGIAREFLLQFQGVGRKVADCVSLYALDFDSLAPVDTHMFQIAHRLFSKTLKKDNNMHDSVQKLMVDRFGEKAGWAHCFLFAAKVNESRPSPDRAKKVRTRE